MNKISKISIVISIVVAAVFIAYSSCQITKSYTTFKLPPNICKAFFGCTPEDFFGKTLDFSWTDDFRNNATIDKDGNLILRLTQKQKDDWKKYFNSSIEIAKKNGIQTSSDFTQMTINCYRDSADLLIIAIQQIQGLAVNQLLAGKEPSTIQIECYVKDALTEKIVYSATWPKEAIRFDFNECDFSERPKTVETVQSGDGSVS